MSAASDPITAVPSAVVPGATPPILPGGGTADPSAQVSEMTKRLLATLAQASQRKQFAGTPVPGAIQPQQDMSAARSIGMNTANPRGWGLQRFAAGIQTSIQNAVSQDKQKKLNKAEADWSYLQSALNEKYQAEASKDPKAIAAAQQKLDVVLGDPKTLKNMAKALNQDWLDPSKTTIYGEALKKVSAKTKQTEQQDQQKQQAAQGLKGMFQKLMQQRQQPQLSPEQQKAMAAEIEAKAPTTTAGMSVKDQTEAAKGILDLEKASKEARENYQTVVSPDGKVWAYNKTNPKDAYQLRDAESGKEITGQTKTTSAPKVVANGNVPYAVVRGGKTVTPDSPEWTKEDQTLFDGALGAARQKQQLKIPPEIGDQIGAPPDPADYTKGTSDPEYAAALRTYGKKAIRLGNTKSLCARHCSRESDQRISPRASDGQRRQCVLHHGKGRHHSRTCGRVGGQQAPTKASADEGHRNCFDQRARCDQESQARRLHARAGVETTKGDERRRCRRGTHVAAKHGDECNERPAARFYYLDAATERARDVAAQCRGHGRGRSRFAQRDSCDVARPFERQHENDAEATRRIRSASEGARRGRRESRQGRGGETCWRWSERYYDPKKGGGNSIHSD